MNGHLHSIQRWFRSLPHDAHTLQVLGAGVGVVVLVALAVWLFVRRRRPSAQEVERRRREAIAVTGRMIDAHLTDARSHDGEESHSPTPDILFYSYKLAGVTYDCAQDVSTLGERVRGYRLDHPVHIRYDPRNPGNSILVSESWSGLGLAGAQDEGSVS